MRENFTDLKQIFTQLIQQIQGVSEYRSIKDYPPASPVQQDASDQAMNSIERGMWQYWEQAARTRSLSQAERSCLETLRNRFSN